MAAMATSDFLHLVIGTAGHIDHGKSALVERLTGHHPDTLKEEQNRGLTINLGYATFALADGRKVGIIDVPGHERFIKNMVAGASGIQFVVFVIASDDGVMPQSREHLDILEILGVRRGVVALTKVDTVDEEMVELASEEIRDFVAGSFLADSPILPVSSITGQGFDALRASIEEALADVHVDVREQPFRMPVQRVFSASGHGTVVTGVPVAGSVRVGESVEILPEGMVSRVRGVQAYGDSIDVASAGHRAALNLADVDYHAIARGIVAAEPGMYTASDSIEARFEHLASQTKPLKHLAPIRFHVGTAETVGRVSLLDRKVLEPGESAFVQLFLQDPVPTAEGDRFILRSISPMHTLGGGLVIGTADGRHRRFREWTIEHLERKERAIQDDRDAYLAEVVFGHARHPRPVAELAPFVHRRVGEITAALAELESRGVVVGLWGGRAYLHRKILEQIEAEISAAIREIHEAHPQSLFVPLREVIARMQLDAKFLDEVIRILSEGSSLRRGPDGRVGLAEFAPSLTPKQREAKDRIEALFRDRGIAPPRRDEVATEVSSSKDEAGRLLDLLHDEGSLVRLKDDRIFHREALDGARDTLTAALEEREKLTAAEIKEYLDTSRKNLIPLLEHFDQAGVTVRNGDYRSLASKGVGT